MNDQENIVKTNDKPTPSPAVIRRLPRYYRYLCELIARGKTRISSGELARMMNVTASQIRQDLNCFGGFGQQGYGYNVNYLFAKISEILGVSAGFKAAIIGAGDLGRALVHLSMFEKRGVDIVALFDTDGEAEGSFKISAPADESNPKTGDSIGLWFAALVLSFSGILGTAFVYQKKFRK